MKKIILLLIMCFFLTGCTLDYNLKFEKDNIEENIVFSFDKDIYKFVDEIQDEDVYYIEQELVETDNRSLKSQSEFYEKNIEVKNGATEAVLKYNYNYENLNDSYLINRCFENVLILNEENYYYISLSGNFYCLSDQDINIKISTDKKVIDHNADSFDNNKYIWKLTPDKEEVNINFHMSKELDKKPSLVEFSGIQITLFIIIVLIVIGFFLLRKKILGNKV